MIEKKLASDEIDLIEVFTTVWKKKWIVVFFIVLSLSAMFVNSFAPTPPIVKEKIKVTTEIRPIEFFDEAKYNMFSSVIEVIAKFNSSYSYEEKSIRNNYLAENNIENTKNIEKYYELQNDKIYNITTSITREFLLNLFIDKLNQKSYLKSTIKKFNLIKEENYPNKIKYEEAVTELSSSIKLINLDVHSIDKKSYIMIAVETFEIENWDNFLKYVENEINLEIQIKLSSLFNNYIDYSKEIKKYKIEDIENQLLTSINEYEIISLKRKKNILLEDRYIERMISIFKRLPFSNANEFYAARIIYDSSVYLQLDDRNTPTTSLKTKYILTILFGTMFGIFFVLVADNIQKKRRR